jgi:hypothetical protein
MIKSANDNYEREAQEWLMSVRKRGDQLVEKWDK